MVCSGGRALRVVYSSLDGEESRVGSLDGGWRVKCIGSLNGEEPRILDRLVRL